MNFPTKQPTRRHLGLLLTWILLNSGLGVTSAAEAQFGGKTLEITCDPAGVANCKTSCPSGYASCEAADTNVRLKCYCHKDNPVSPEAGYTCDGPKRVTPTDSPSSKFEPVDDCQKRAARQFTEDVDVYTCTKDEVRTNTICVIIDFSSPPTTTAASVFPGSEGGCDECQVGDTFLDFLLCPIICTVFSVVRFVHSLLLGVIQTVGQLLFSIPSLLNELVGALSLD